MRYFNQLLGAALLLTVQALSLSELQADDGALKKALTFHASFDKGTDADFAKGDPKLYTLVDRDKKIGQAGLHTEGRTAIAKGAGKFGGALKFSSGDAPWIYYHAKKNVDYQKENWSGSVSLWLKCEPEKILPPGYSDPVQITPKKWDDASLFLDFSKKGERWDFRLGAFADTIVWNPHGKDIPETERPLLVAKRPKFAPDRWTHVVFTWAGFNNAREPGIAKLYIDGELDGEMTRTQQIFTWHDASTPRLLLGLVYVGLIDEVACFDRALDAAEVRQVFQLDGGVGTLLD
jgi:hypothetical protein